MKGACWSCFAVAFLATGVFGVPSPVWSGTAVEVFRKVAPSIVVVLALDQDGGAKAQGSGVVVAKKEVVTNCHVLRRSVGVVVRQASGSGDGKTWRMKASLLVAHEERDLCLLHVEELSRPPAASVARLGSARELSTGEEVFAIGAPAGLELSLSRGVVSQLRRIAGQRRAPLVQTDAAISPGSSGGGLFDDKGELVGITTFKWRGESLNFALPVEWVRELLKEASRVKTRSACLVKPSFECVMDLARDAAYGTGDPYLRGGALASIAAAEAIAKDARSARQTLAAAFGTARNIVDVDLRGDLLHRIARTQAEVGDVVASLKTASEIPNPYPHVNHFGTSAGALIGIVLVQAREESVEAALKTARGIQDPWARAFVLGKLAVLQTDTRVQQAARRAFAAVLETALNIADGRIRKGALEAVARAIYEWKGESFGIWDPDLLSNIAVLQAMIGDATGALKTVQDIEQDWQRSHALKWIGVFQARSGNISSALRVAEQLEKELPTSGGLVFDNVAVQQAETGDIAGALLTAQKLSFVRRADTLATIAAVQAKAGDEEGARGTFAAALEATLGNHSLFARIAVKQAETGDIAGALLTAKSIGDAHTRAETLATIGAAQTEAGHEAAARRTLAAASETARGVSGPYSPGFEKEIKSVEASLLARIARAQAEAGDRRGALRTLAAALEKGLSDDWDLEEIAKQQAAAGDVMAALKTANAINNADNRTRALIDIGVHQVNAGARHAARRAFDSALKAVLRVDVGVLGLGDRKGYHVHRIALGLATAGYIATAVKTAQGNVDALGSIAVVQAEAGRFRDAVNTAIKIDHVDIRADSLAKIAVRHKRHDREESLALTASDRVLVQRGLLELGKEVGSADGIFGPRTRAALRSWQTDRGAEVTGYLTQGQADELKAAGD